MTPCELSPSSPRAPDPWQLIGAGGLPGPHVEVLGLLAAPPDSPGLLTRREREVAQPAADARRSREIAEQLFLSTGTAEAHLSRICRKLDNSSRVGLSIFLDGGGADHATPAPNRPHRRRSRPPGPFAVSAAG